MEGRVDELGREVTGIIVPLQSTITNRIFHHHDIYAIVWPQHSTKLDAGDRVFFYDPAKGLEGEAAIESMSFERARDVKRYGHDLYLSGEELDGYLRESGADENSRMLVIKLAGATKYSRPLKCSLQVGKQGHYVTAEVFKSVLNENQ